MVKEEGAEASPNRSSSLTLTILMPKQDFEPEQHNIL
jgi:hypothetical protein